MTRRPGLCLALIAASIAASGCGGGSLPVTITQAQLALPEIVTGPGSPPPTSAPKPSTAPGSAPVQPATLPVIKLPSSGGASGGGSSGGSAGGSGGGGTSSAPAAPASAATDAPAGEASPSPDPTTAPETLPTASADPTPTPSPTDAASPSPSPAGATPTPTPTPSPTPTPHGTLVTWAGNGTAGLFNATGKAARFNLPYGVATDAAGNVYVADAFNHCIRKVTPSGVVTTLAGTGRQGYADGPGTTAQFNSPLDVAALADGTVYVSDTWNHCIRKITPSGVVSTLAGRPEIAYDAVGYPLLSYPAGLAVSANGTVYVADPGLQAIRAIAPNGTVSNLAGQYWNAEGGLADGTGTAAFFQEPMDVALDRSGNLYVADTSNHRIRKVTPAGVVTTVAGSGTLGVWGGGYADGSASTAQFNHPYGLAVDAAGTIYVADKDNQRLRKLTAGGTVSTLAGTGSAGLSDGPGGTASLNSPVGLAIDAQGRLIVADTLNHALRALYP
jgi:sugar lactone lactonase YvrE